MSTPQHPTPERPTPEEQGIPDHADDTSTAFSEADRPRFNDSPPAMPADEPQAVDEHGLTAAEARDGEPLEQRLAREEPDSDRGSRIPELEPPEGGMPEGEFPDRP